MRLKHVEAVSFDLDDTLWAFDAAVRQAEAVLYQWLSQHAPLTAGMLGGPEALQHARQWMAIEQPELAATPARLRKASIHEVLRLAGDDPALSEPGYAVFYAARQRVKLFDDVVPSLQWLSARYPLAVITNGNSDVAAIGLAHFFQTIIAAKDVGMDKPDPGIFSAAADALGVAPEQLLHVGDDQALDADGACDAGLQAAWLVRNEHFIEAGLHRSAVVIPDLYALCRLLKSV